MSENCGRQSLFTDIPGLFWLDLRHYFTDQIILEIILTIENTEINYRKPASLANNNVNCIGFHWYKFNKLQKCNEMLKNFLNFLVWLFFDPFLCSRRVPLSLKSTIKKKCAEENSRWITFSNGFFQIVKLNPSPD